MAKIAGKNLNFAINSVALEDEVSSVTLNVNQAVPVVTALSDVGPRRVADNYDWDINMSGFSDFAASQGDATIFAMLGSAGVASAYDPTGNTAGAGDPNYDGTVVLGSYSTTAAVGAGISYSATFNGTSALTRAVA